LIPQKLSIKISTQGHLDFIVTGTVETGPDTYTIHLQTRRLLHAPQVIGETTVLRRTEFTDRLSEPIPPKTPYPVVQASGPGRSVEGVPVPVSGFCPPPSYNDEARRAKIPGTSVFEVLISSTGEVVKTQPTK
jgi:hypothetical protein